MKRLGIILGVIVLAIFLMVYLSTSSIDTTAYFESGYYRQTLTRLDSIHAEAIVERDSVRAGFSKVSITPALHASEDDYAHGKFTAIPLAGYGGREGKAATGIHDSVFIKAAALRVGGKTLVFVSADLLIMPPNIVDSVTVRLAKEGIERDQILYSATHTHSSVGAWGPGYVGEMFAGKENLEVEKWLVHQTYQAITSALKDLKPARVGTGNFSLAAYTRNRLIGKSGNKNNDFSFIILEQVAGKKAVLGSYSAHATTLGAENMEVSADYPGYWANRMESSSVDYAMFFAGSVGSQSPVSEGKGFDKAKYLGEALADSLNVRLAEVFLTDTVGLSSLSVRMTLPQYNIRLTTHRNLATVWSEKLLPLSDNVYVQAVRIGNMVWITTPSDFSGEYALQLKRSLASFGFNGNVTSFNGNYVGYIVPGRYFYLDEYEPKVMGWFGPTMGDYTMDIMRQVSRAITHTDNI